MVQKQKSNLKKKLKEKKLTFGSWITIGDPIIAELMANTGFDWLTIDMEHSVITLTVAQDLIRVIELAGCTPLVRVSNNDPSLIKRVMDAGAHGVIVPMVNTKADAEAAVNAVRYPPQGFRGVGLARAQKYGFDFDGYKTWLEHEGIVIVQIEHKDAVRNLSEILAVEGVDGFIVGPYDISGSLGIPGEFTNPRFKKILQDIMKKVKQSKQPAGYHVIPPDIKEVQNFIDLGYRFIAISLDTLFLGTACQTVLSKLK
jgi:2-keto-3-deoxy-L-rhamnonate aldolase RhmA